MARAFTVPLYTTATQLNGATKRKLSTESPGSTGIGGAGYLWGAILGAAVLTILKDQLQSYLPALLGSNGNFEIIVFGVLMVVLLH